MMEGDDSEPNLNPRRAGVSRWSPDSSDSDSDEINKAAARKRKRTFVIDDTGSSSDTSMEEVVLRKRLGRPVLISDTDSSSSSDEDKKNCDAESSDSDGQSEKCPICLKSFKLEEIATPESCDHTFCIECIKEWSKNVNTCPVDRQTFSLILVRSHINGKVVRQIPIETPATLEEPILVPDDSTMCEICRRSDREDRMLLCDGCDLGYHMECLTPPMREIPTGTWFCDECGIMIGQNFDVYIQEVELLLSDASDMPRPVGRRRLIPRTRQSERVRETVLTRRARRDNESTSAADPASATIDQPGTSTRRATITTRTKRRKKRRATKRRTPRVKVTYQIDEETGQEYYFKTTVSSYRKRRKRKTKKARLKAAGPKTTKKRLAEQLGMCGRKHNQQNIPEVRASTENTHLNFQRYQAGIPTLSLFGNREELDYFSDIDDEQSGGLMVARRPNMQDVALLQRERRKNITINAPASSCDILGSILESQEKFHSKNTVLSITNDGRLQVESNNNRVVFNGGGEVRVRKAAGVDTASDPKGGDNKGEVNATTSNSDAGGYSVSTSSQASYEAQSVLEPENNPEQNASESEIDIYSDIETVSTSNKVEEEESKPTTPVEVNFGGSDDEANNSDIDLVIDTEKQEVQEQETTKEETVTSTTNPITEIVDDDDDSEDGCPNFSIYSTESIKLAKSSDLQLIQEKIMINQTNEVGSSLDVKVSHDSDPPVINSSIQESKTPQSSDHNSSDQITIDHHNSSDQINSDHHNSSDLNSSKIADSSAGNDKDDSSSSDSSDDDDKAKDKSKATLYSDSDDEVIKIDKNSKPFEIADLQGMTEDISEEERSYTPCLDERGGGLEGLETEAISDEEKNDFDESHDNEVKTTSDGDALEINAKESELDLVKPEDFEEGEIVDKLKKLEEAKKNEGGQEKEEEVAIKEKVAPVSTEKGKETTFKKITKTNRSRNYRDKDKERSKSPSNKEKNEERERRKRKEKRKEIERYNVRSLVSEKPSRLKDRFGRDRRSASSRSNSPFSPRRRSYSRNRSVTRRRTRSRSRRRRSTSRRRKRNRSKEKKRKSRNRTRSPTPKRRKDWERGSRGWSPSISRSRTPERQASPSWTPPRLLEKPVKPHNLTVILTNDSTKKKKEKRKTEKRKKDTPAVPEPQPRKKRNKRDKTPPPSKEVFASGDNILVSVSFNKENDEREATVRKKREEPTKKKSKRSPKVKRKKTHDLSGVKPVAIIDLDRSPFRELTPSPNDVIVLSDSDNTEQVENSNPPIEAYPSGPKTPPEPQVKFTLNPKQPQLRNINNPLHEPDEIEMEIEPQEELEARLNEALHKGPNTPPEPPNSPPSSPDAYDPFDPTKSRSPTPEPEEATTEKSDVVEQQDQSLTPRLQSPDRKSHTPPVVPDIQPADSQSNPSVTSPDPKRTPERPIGVIINQVAVPTSTPKNNTSTLVTKTSPSKIKLTTLNSNGTNKAKTTIAKKINRSNDSNDSNVDFESPYSPGPSDYEDLFEPPIESNKTPTKQPKPKPTPSKPQSSFDSLFGSSPPPSMNKKSTNSPDKKKRTPKQQKTKTVGVKLDEDMLRILDDVPNSAVELQVKDKFLKKLNRQERVVEEVKLVLKPHYNKKHINKDEYKDIMRRAVPKICHSKSGEINPKKIHNLIEAYVKKFRHSKKVSSSSSVNPQK